MTQLPPKSPETNVHTETPSLNPDELISSDEKQTRLFAAIQENLIPHSTHELNDFWLISQAAQPLSMLDDEALIRLAKDAAGFYEDANNTINALSSLRNRIVVTDRVSPNNYEGLPENKWADLPEMRKAMANVSRIERLFSFAATADPLDDYMDDSDEPQDEKGIATIQETFDRLSVEEVLVRIQQATRSERDRAKLWLEELVGSDDGETFRPGLIDIPSDDLQRTLYELMQKPDMQV